MYWIIDCISKLKDNLNSIANFRNIIMKKGINDHHNLVITLTKAKLWLNHIIKWGATQCWEAFLYQFSHMVWIRFPSLWKSSVVL